MSKRYQCTVCNHFFQVSYSAGNNRKRMPCPQCGGKAQRRYQQPTAWRQRIVSSGWGRGGPQGRSKY